MSLFTFGHDCKILILNLSKPERTGTGVMDVAIGAPETKQAS